MARRRRITPFARFFIFIIIAAPLALLIAMLAGGEELSMAGIKNVFSNAFRTEEPDRTGVADNETNTSLIEDVTVTEAPATSAPATATDNQNSRQNAAPAVQMIEFRALQSYVAELEKRIEKLETELRTLQRAQQSNSE